MKLLKYLYLIFFPIAGLTVVLMAMLANRSKSSFQDENHIHYGIVATALYNRNIITDGNDKTPVGTLIACDSFLTTVDYSKNDNPKAASVERIDSFRSAGVVFKITMTSANIDSTNSVWAITAITLLKASRDCNIHGDLDLRIPEDGQPIKERVLRITVKCKMKSNGASEEVKTYNSLQGQSLEKIRPIYLEQ